MPRLIPALTALGAATLLLAGCSSSPTTDSIDGGKSKSSSTVFDFPLNGGQPSLDVTVSVPKNLREAIGSEAQALLVDSIRLTPHKLDGIKLCAVDFAITYAEGGFDVISKPADIDAIVQKSVDSMKTDLAHRLNVDTYADVPGALEKIAAAAPSASSKHDILVGPAGLGPLIGNEAADIEGDSWRSFMDRIVSSVEQRYREDAEKQYDKPQDQLISSRLGFPAPGVPMSKLDDAAPEKGTYVSEDGAKVTAVETCASSANDPDANVSFRLPMRGEDNQVGTFAETTVAVMTDGTLGVAGKVTDYRRDANSNWIVR